MCGTPVAAAVCGTLFHDGSRADQLTTHHSGRVLSDEHSGDHEA